LRKRGTGPAAAWGFAAARKSAFATLICFATGLAAVATLAAVVALSAPALAKQARILKPSKAAAPPADAAAEPSADSIPANADGGDDAGGMVADPSGSVETLDGDVDNPDGGGDSAGAGQSGKLDPSGDGAAPHKKFLLAPPAPGPVADGPARSFTLEARLTEASPPLMRGLSWRIFDAAPTSDGKLRLVGEAHGGSVRMMLKPGSYFVHASYGRASAMRTITVGAGVDNDNVVLNAGGLRLSAMVGKDQPLNATDVSFDIFAPDEDGTVERSPVVSSAPAGRIIGLNAGTYHVVCHYGAANAIVRADIKIQPGKLTEAAVYQKAARLTLKLVSEQGGEAIANTKWSVVTPAGEDIADFVGAFPSVVLAAGDYTAIAKHEGKMYERNFTVEAGLNHDIEVIAK
jgi:hypothetical protein